MEKERHDLGASEWKTLPNQKLRITPERSESEITTNIDLNLASGRYQFYETTQDNSYQRWIIEDNAAKYNAFQLTHTQEDATIFLLWSRKNGEINGFNVIVSFPFKDTDSGKITMRYDLDGNVQGVHVVTDPVREFEVEGDAYAEPPSKRRSTEDNFADLLSIYRLDDLRDEEKIEKGVDEISYAETRHFIWNRLFARRLSIEDPETPELFERLVQNTAYALPEDFNTKSKRARRTTLESKLHKVLVMELAAYEQTLKHYDGDEFEIHPGVDVDKVYSYDDEDWSEMQAGSEFLFGEYGITLERHEGLWEVKVKRYGMFQEEKVYIFPDKPGIAKFKELIQGDTDSGWQHAADHIKIEKQEL